MAQVTFTGNKGKAAVTINGERVTIHIRRYRDKRGQWRTAVGSRHIRLTGGKRKV